MRKKRKAQHDSCTIQRDVLLKHGYLDSQTASFVETSREQVVKACAIPLFGDDDKARGVCRSCSEGWEHAENRFATDAERKRATEGAE